MFALRLRLRLGLAMSVMTTAVAGHLAFDDAAAIAAFGLATAAPFAFEELS